MITTHRYCTGNRNRCSRYGRERSSLFEENKIAKEHASWLHAGDRRILADGEKPSRSAGRCGGCRPGSYTGLRVAMAAAKGFCYALKIPLITLNSLVVMAESMKSEAVQENRP